MSSYVLSRAAALALLGSFVAVSSCKKAGAEGGSNAVPDIATLAVDAYVFGYPLITMDQTRLVMTNVATPEEASGRAPMGQFANARGYPDASFRDVTAPNANTLYSTAWLDLAKEPYVLSLPDEHGRYYLMPMLSGWTEVFRVPGTRTTGTGAQRYLIIGPNWKGPAIVPAATLVKSPTNLVWIIGRTFARDTPVDLQMVHDLQRQYMLVPLGAFGRTYTPPPGNVDPSIDMKTPVRDQVNALHAATFFNRLAMLMKDNPPSKADSTIVAQMATIGIVPGQPFDTTRLSPELAKVMKDVPRLGMQRIMAVGKGVPVVNGWMYSTRTGRYGTDYDVRAYAAVVGLGANLPQDAVYPFTEVDGAGQRLDGARRYVLHFDRGQEPPVKGFWSVTMYNPQYFFVANPINRYQISPKQSPVTYNPDGSLDLYIQHDSPGAGKESNWLPAPTGHFILMMRMYEPDTAVINGTWKPPAVAVVRTAIPISKQ